MVVINVDRVVMETEANLGFSGQPTLAHTTFSIWKYKAAVEMYATLTSALITES